MEDINNKELKTADYIRRAVKNYENTKDKITIIADKGIKEKIKKKYGNISISKYINDLINADLNDGKQEPKKPPKKSAPVVKVDDHGADLDDPALIFENYKEK